MTINCSIIDKNKKNNNKIGILYYYKLFKGQQPFGHHGLDEKPEKRIPNLWVH